MVNNSNLVSKAMAVQSTVARKSAPKAKAVKKSVKTAATPKTHKLKIKK